MEHLAQVMPYILAKSHEAESQSSAHGQSPVDSQRTGAHRVCSGINPPVTVGHRPADLSQDCVRLVSADHRWERAEGTARGQISHSICFDCFAPVFRELDPGNALPPFSQQVDSALHAQQW